MLIFWKIISTMLNLFKKLFFRLPLTALIVVLGLIFMVLGLLRLVLSIAFNPLFLIILVVVLIVKSPKNNGFYDRN